MRFTEKELERMTKAQLIKHIFDMYVEKDKTVESKKSRAGIYINGASELVRKYHEHELRAIKDKGGE